MFLKTPFLDSGEKLVCVSYENIAQGTKRKVPRPIAPNMLTAPVFRLLVLVKLHLVISFIQQVLYHHRRIVFEISWFGKVAELLYKINLSRPVHKQASPCGFRPREGCRDHTMKQSRRIIPDQSLGAAYMRVRGSKLHSHNHRNPSD